MGVPAFYRWISEKYPKIVVDILEQRNNVVQGTVIPVDLNQPNPNAMEFDNLYVDMNGLIHPCSHPEDRAAPTTEEEMYENVTKYVDRLVAAIRPRRLIYLAIDGVAPRAKMNQQRSRRFRAAQDAKDRKKQMEEVMSEMAELGFKKPNKSSDEWDSNVITPGTEFMLNLSTYLKNYIADKIAHDSYWKKLKIVLSDASEPGEGEHKIMQFVRSQRTNPDFDPNQHHVLHGLDADLIMLGLATHEARFTILREKVFFGRKGNDDSTPSDGQRMLDAARIEDGGSLSALYPEDEWIFGKPLQALHISILREYLDLEFSILKSCPSITYDLERIIDDFIFLCFFVGNDFLPHLPSLDIRDGALDFLIDVYKQSIPSLGDYITYPSGNINLRHVDIILAKVAEIEEMVFQKRKESEDMQERKRQYHSNKNPTQTQATAIQTEFAALQSQIAANSADTNKANANAAANLKAQLSKKRNSSDISEETNKKEKNLETKVITEAEFSSELKKRLKDKENSIFDTYKQSITDNIKLHETGWKDRYYNEEHKRKNIDEGGGLRNMCTTYVEGLCWVMKYYYEGVPSWNWYYPFHYAPFASDLVNIDSFKLRPFVKSTPFRPLEQLLAVLPPTSAKALPEPCQWLMLNIESPIIDCYNDDVPIDPNGKHLPWLWILLLPFIDESRIVNAFESIKEKLNEKEQHRNNLGCSYLYLHQSHPLAVEASKILAGDSPEHAKFVFDGKIGKGIGGIVYKTLLEGHGESVLCWKYDAPTYSNHKSSLLPGVIMPAPTLDDNDRVSTRGPRLNRGFNILDFTQQNNSSNSNQHKRFYDGKTQSNFNNNNNYRNNNNYNSSSNYANNNNHHKQPRVDYQQHATSNYSVNYGGNQNRNRSYPPQGYDRGNFPVPNQKYAQHGPQQNSFPAYYQNYNGMGFVPNQFGMESSYMQNLSIGRGEMSLANNLAVQAPPPSFPHPNMKSMREQLMQTLNRRDSTKGPRNQ